MKSSQVSLPRDSHGEIDFSKYPFQVISNDHGSGFLSFSCAFNIDLDVELYSFGPENFY
jgi:hypothetical protein